MAEPTSLKDVVREQIMTNILKPSKSYTAEFKAMIVDSVALRILSTAFRMSEIVAEGITVVEDLRKGRQPLPLFQAIYMCAPTSENVDLINRDFERTKKYQAIHVFFLDACPDQVFSRLSSKVSAVMKTLKELSMLFVPSESQVFSTEDADGFYDFYSRNSRSDKTAQIAASIGSLCCCLDETPTVRYQGSNEKIQTLATAVQQRLDFLRDKINPEMTKASKGKRSQIVLLDRSVDLFSPLLHELTYQAAAYDLLEIDHKDNSFTYTFEDAKGRQQKKTALLNEEDEVWTKFRHEHISRVFKDISQSLQDFAAKKQDVSQGASKAKDTKDLKELMKKIPQHQEEMNRYSLHLELSNQINKAFTKKIEDCTRAEQNMVMYMTPEGTKVRNHFDQISGVLVSNVGDENKLRAIMLCVLAQKGVKASELQDLFRNAEIPESKRSTVTNLEDLGADVTVTKSSKAKPAKRRDREPEFELSRWTPVVKDIMEDAISGKLDVKEFPATRDIPQGGGDDDGDDAEVASARKGGWTKKAKQKNRDSEDFGKKVDNSRPRLIVFIVGSVSFNEMRCAYEVAQEAKSGWDVFIGSQSIVRPADFLDKVSSLSRQPAVLKKDEGEGGLTIVSGNSRTQMEADKEDML